MTFRIGTVFEVGTERGEPILAGDRQLVPVVRVVRLLLGRRGAPAGAGLVWTRPIAVEVSGPEGPRRLTIPLANRRLLLGLGAGLGLAGLLTLQQRLLRTNVG